MVLAVKIVGSLVVDDEVAGVVAILDVAGGGAVAQDAAQIYHLGIHGDVAGVAAGGKVAAAVARDAAHSLEILRGLVHGGVGDGHRAVAIGNGTGIATHQAAQIDAAVGIDLHGAGDIAVVDQAAQVGRGDAAHLRGVAVISHGEPEIHHHIQIPHHTLIVVGVGIAGGKIVEQARHTLGGTGDGHGGDGVAVAVENADEAAALQADGGPFSRKGDVPGQVILTLQGFVAGADGGKLCLGGDGGPALPAQSLGLGRCGRDQSQHQNQSQQKTNNSFCHSSSSFPEKIRYFPLFYMIKGASSSDISKWNKYAPGEKKSPGSERSRDGQFVS